MQNCIYKTIGVESEGLFKEKGSKLNNKNNTETNVFLELNFDECYAMITDGSAAHVFDIAINNLHSYMTNFLNQGKEI